jgi:superfamily II DNA or RNA helicase
MLKISIIGNYASILGDDLELKKARPIVDKATSFWVKGYRFSPLYQRKRWDGKKHLITARNTIPSGLAHIVRQALVDAEFQAEVYSVKHEPVPYDERYLREINLHRKSKKDGKVYSYQSEAVKSILRHERGILHMATNSGKTECAIAAAKMFHEQTGKNVLFITHRKQLARQTIRRFGKEFDKVGFIGEGEWSPVDGVTVAIVDSISRASSKDTAERLLSEFYKDGMLILDECLPGDTMIQTEDGSKRIDEMKGYSKKVLAFDAERGKFMWKRVLNWFAKGKQPVIEITHERGKLRCTTEHRVLTSNGWKEAGKLTTQDLLIACADAAEKSQAWINEADPGGSFLDIRLNLGLIAQHVESKWKKAHHFVNVDAALRSLCQAVMRKIRVKNGTGPRIYQDIIQPKTDHLYLNRLSALFMEPCSATLPLDIPIQRQAFQEYPTHMDLFRLSMLNTRRLNLSGYTSPAKNSKVAGTENSPSGEQAHAIHPLSRFARSFDQTEIKKRSQKNGLSTYPKKVWRGGIWTMGRFLVSASNYTQRGTRRKKTGLLRDFFRRLELWGKRNNQRGVIGLLQWDLKRLKFGSTDSRNTLPHLCSINFSRVLSFRETATSTEVFDLEIEDLHNFVANGVVVHNCHHAPSAGWYDLSMKCRARIRIGMSGTPLLRGDGANIMLIGATGPVISKVTNRDLIDWGFSVPPIMLYQRVETPTCVGYQFREAYKRAIAVGFERNNHISHWAKEFYDQGLQTVILYWDILHGACIHKFLKEILPENEILLMAGTLSKAQKNEISKSHLAWEPILHKVNDREAALKKFERGEARVLISSSILDEGMDIDNIDAMIFGSGQKSHLRELQRIGRGIRISGKLGVVFIVDFADFMHDKLLEHSLERFKVAKSEGFEQIEARPEMFGGILEGVKNGLVPNV